MSRALDSRSVQRGSLMVVVAAALLTMPQPVAAARTWHVRSPNRGLSVAVVQASRLRLEIRRGRSSILSSSLGLVTGSTDLGGRGLRLTRRTHRRVLESYTTPAGKRRSHRIEANEITLWFAQPGRAAVGVQVMAADDGVAFRYLLSGRDPVRVMGERTTFRSTPGARAWLQPYRANYESTYRRTELRRARGRFGFPVLLRSGARGTWALVTESDVDGRYVASHLTASAAHPGVLRLAFGQHAVRSRRPLATPWRVAVVGTLATIVESDLPLSLGRPARVGDFAWVRPGRVAWSWWSDSTSPASYERQTQYVDFAARMGWEYVEVDSGWSAAWMPDLVRYAHQRGVDVLVWADWSDLATPTQRDALLSLWRSWGVAGVKLDYMQSDRQARMRWYDDVARAAADRKLVVDFHGATIPHGIQRTWPNVLTMEAVRGAEYYKAARIGPRHNAVLPFTRNAIGSMDYTPVAFSAPRRATSAGHELALSIVYESGLQHFADSPESYAGNPVALDLLGSVPAAWDQTEYVAGSPGRSATLARRKGDDWFIGSIAAGGPHTTVVPLDFLAAGRPYAAEIIDDTGRDGLVATRRIVTRRDRLRVALARNGGFAARLCPLRASGPSCLDTNALG